MGHQRRHEGCCRRGHPRHCKASRPTGDQRPLRLGPAVWPPLHSPKAHGQAPQGSGQQGCHRGCRQVWRCTRKALNSSKPKQNNKQQKIKTTTTTTTTTITPLPPPYCLFHWHGMEPELWLVELTLASFLLLFFFLVYLSACVRVCVRGLVCQ